MFSRAEHALRASEPPARLLDRPQGSWNRAFGSTWNARSAFGTARKALAALVLFVGRRYYLRPNPPFGLGPPAGYWNARSASGTIWNRASGSIWNGLRPFGPPAGLSAVARVRVCGGNAMNVR